MIETFITVHDQDIIIKNELEKKYRHLSKYRYIFVGKRDYSKIKHMDNVLIATEFDDNIEEFNYLVDFTAWYLLVKNNLINTKFVSLIQYDTDITEELTKTLNLLTNNENSILGYVPYLIESVDFLGTKSITEPLFKSLSEVYAINTMELVNQYISKTKEKFWPSSNNVALSKKNLEDFIEWSEPIMRNLNNDRYSGHAMERIIKIFSIIRNIENIYLEDILKHYQLDSHNTQQNKK